MCDAQITLTCSVCTFVGAVDRVLRGGTDDGDDYVALKKLGGCVCAL